MPSTYTAPIENGITFQKFALGCARRFGACISLRDSDEPIPDKFEVEPYYINAVVDARVELNRLESLTPDAAAQEHRAECDAENAANAVRKAKNKVLSDKYVAMMEQVTAWVPPTKDHVELKKFMESQLHESMDMDCSEPYRNHEDNLCTGTSNWLYAKLAEARRKLESSTVNLAKETTSVANRNAWIAALRASL